MSGGKALPESYSSITFAEGTPAHAELSAELDGLGLQFKQAQLGGVAEVVDVVVAWFSLHDFWVGVASGLATTKIASAVHRWVRRNELINAGHRNVIRLAVYEKKQCLYILTIDVDRDMKPEDLGPLIAKANDAINESE